MGSFFLIAAVWLCRRLAADSAGDFQLNKVNQGCCATTPRGACRRDEMAAYPRAPAPVLLLMGLPAGAASLSVHRVNGPCVRAGCIRYLLGALPELRGARPSAPAAN